MMPQPVPAHQPAESKRRSRSGRTAAFLALGALVGGSLAARAAYQIGRAEAQAESTRLRERLATAAARIDRDALTHLPNRAALLRELDAWSARRKPFLALFVDLDDFKPINDTHGHGVGDAVLVFIANRLADIARLHDGLAFRLGGDEFVVMLPDPAGSAPPLQTVWDLRDRLSEPMPIDGTLLNIASSIGVLRVNEPLSSGEILRRIDSAMYRAKHDRGCVKTYEPGLDDTPPAERPLRRRRDRRESAATTARAHLRSAA
jgi:diguanylate cyclase (GGDEF)-like protein